MNRIQPLSKRVLFFTGRNLKMNSNSTSDSSNPNPSCDKLPNDLTSGPTSKNGCISSAHTRTSTFSLPNSLLHLFNRFPKSIILAIISLLCIIFITLTTLSYYNHQSPHYAALSSLHLPSSQPRLTSEDWDAIRYLLNHQTDRLVQSFANHSLAQHLASDHPLPVCQSLVAEKQTFVQLSNLIFHQFGHVQITDLTVNPNLDLISILIKFKKPIISGQFHYQMNASIDRHDWSNQSVDSAEFVHDGQVALQASDWKVAVFAQLHHFDNDAQRVYLRDVEIRSFISPQRLHLHVESMDANATTNQTNRALEWNSMRSSLSDCISEQLRYILETQITDYIKSNLLCDSKVSTCPRLRSPDLSFARHMNAKLYRPMIAFHNHDLEHVLRLNASILNSFQNRAKMSENDLSIDLAQRLSQEQRIPSSVSGWSDSSVIPTIDQHLEHILNHALIDMQSSDFVDTSVSGLPSDVNVPSDQDSSETGDSVPLQRSKRQVPCERGQELDEYVDSLFRFASRVVKAMEPFSLPNATVHLPEYNMKLFLHHGGASRAYTLTRKRAAWVYCTNESVSLGLTVGFEDLRIKYKYRAIKDWNLLWDGELEAKLEHTKLQVQFTQTTPDEDSEVAVQQRVDRIRIWRVGHVRVMIKGLGNLTQGVSMLLTNMLNQNIAQLDPTLRHLEGEAVQIANRLLRNVSIPFFSII